jgi:hypothetical protein
MVSKRFIPTTQLAQKAEGWPDLNLNYKLYETVYKFSLDKTEGLGLVAKHLVDRSNENLNIPSDQLGYYLAGLLEGDGHISLPSVGSSSLNRILNPRIVFTSHSNNLELYANIQNRLGGIGRFQLGGGNVLRYIIGDIKGIQLLISLIHGKFRTPKNKRFNQLIEILNTKYSLNLPESSLDLSELSSNCWFTGFTEADGHFGVKYVEFKPKNNNKRSVSRSIGILFRLDQRAYDRTVSLSFTPIMEQIALFLNCKLSTYKLKKTKEMNSTIPEVFSVSVSSIEKLKPLRNNFNQFPLLGVKGKDFKDW